MHRMYDDSPSKCMDNLPKLKTCCHCCFLRAGTVGIAITTFIIGAILAPNVTYTQFKLPWLTNMEADTSRMENGLQMVTGLASIMLCFVSILLVFGALCNAPKLLKVYQGGLVSYCIVTALVNTTLSILCFTLAEKCLSAGIALLFLTTGTIFLMAYFMAVVNSLRVTLLNLSKNGVII